MTVLKANFQKIFKKTQAKYANKINCLVSMIYLLERRDNKILTDVRTPHRCLRA